MYWHLHPVTGRCPTSFLNYYILRERGRKGKRGKEGEKEGRVLGGDKEKSKERDSYEEMGRGKKGVYEKEKAEDKEVEIYVISK